MRRLSYREGKHPLQVTQLDRGGAGIPLCTGRLLIPLLTVAAGPRELCWGMPGKIRAGSLARSHPWSPAPVNTSGGQGETTPQPLTPMRKGWAQLTFHPRSHLGPGLPPALASAVLGACPLPPRNATARREWPSSPEWAKSSETSASREGPQAVPKAPALPAATQPLPGSAWGTSQPLYKWLCHREGGSAP